MAKLYILFPVALYLTLLLHAACVTADTYFEGGLDELSDDGKQGGINAHQKFSLFGSGTPVGRKFSMGPSTSGGSSGGSGGGSSGDYNDGGGGDGDDNDSGADDNDSGGLPDLAALGLPPVPQPIARLGKEVTKHLGSSGSSSDSGSSGSSSDSSSGGDGSPSSAPFSFTDSNLIPTT
ncbi:hypothetical protein POM88_013073 [Heracleum sosnowskyi]|uniref:Glycine-rich protein n=1 Tax=Heracleum sosnowskyi TaxID=360622 RepID=A0AAD8J149_9APIA|nr:hypothetical protein POM88_013073 [Heracleum sosnowskyi]